MIRHHDDDRPATSPTIEPLRREPHGAGAPSASSPSASAPVVEPPSDLLRASSSMPVAVPLAGAADHAAAAGPAPTGDTTKPVDPDGATVSWDGMPVQSPVRRASGTGAPALLQRVAQFVLLERLGAGGMGVVYAAFDEKLERKVAIKLVAAHTGDPRAQDGLLREAQAQARLTHPNVVTVYEVGTLPDGRLFIAMELVKGQTLREWQRTPRTWQDLLAKYAAAGEGVAAAHRAGIIHRDFKPDNVLVGDDGRVRVADFGLAFAVEGPIASVREPDSERVAAGTPGYIAPEQFAGGAVDARTDQFSFCVALYEALHRERPYPDLAFARGQRPAPRRTEPDPGYPRWLWDAVMRGVALDPAQRFASMDALLVELARHRGRTRRRALAAALAGALAIGGGSSAALLAGHDPDPCPLATAELAGVWDPATQLRIGAALLGTGTAFAPNMWRSTKAALDRYAQRWIGAQRTACEATHVRHVQSAELLDRRIECLASRRRSLAAATDVLQRRPAQAVAHAEDILSSLGEIDLCADTGVLLELPRLGAAPLNAIAQARIADVRAKLASARALLATGDVGAAAPVVSESARLAKGLDYGPIHAELREVEGRVALARGEIPASIQLFQDAIELATASHHDELPADIWLMLAIGVGAREQRPAEIESWLGQGEAWIRRLGHPSDPRRVDVEHARGNLQVTAGNAHEAQATLSRALAAAEALWGTDDPRLIPLLRDRAVALARAGQAKPAVADGERALALGIAAWGPDYPDIARTRRNLGLLYIEQLGDVERGEREITMALHQFSAQLGPDSIEVANCEQALSQAGHYRGDYAASLEHVERAEQIYARRLGADHPRRGEALMGIGVLRLMRKDYAGSLAADEAAYPILRAALGPDHTTVGLLLSNTGETLLALGRADRARTNFEQALAILRKSLGPDHTDLALPLMGLGLSHLGAGRPRDALAPLERSLALCMQSPARDPQELAEIRWGLARTLRILGRDAPRARDLAEAAMEGYRGLGPEWAARVREIADWLAAGGVRGPGEPRAP